VLALTKIGNVVESATDAMPRYVGILQMSRRIIFFTETQSLGIDTGDYVTKFFDLSDVSIEGVVPADQSALDAAFTELFRLDTDGSGGGGSGSETFKLNLTGAEGDTTVSSGMLSGKTILTVLREGIGFKQVSSDPGPREFSFSGTTLTFLNQFNPGDEDIEILYK
jgi:hypothetical protein